MTAQAVTVTVDCADAPALAQWYVAAFGGEILRDGGSFVLTRLEGMGINLGFQRVPEPKAGKNRLHLDLHPGEGRRAEEVERLKGLGASVLRHVREPAGEWVVMADPEGNEFCVS
jgi:hypothetical protein